jgi:flavin-binding protein dodecin
MALLKVIELLADSDKSWEDAAQNAVTEAAKTVKNIRSVYINEKTATVKEGKIDKFRVNAKITFEVNVG